MNLSKPKFNVNYFVVIFQKLNLKVLSVFGRFPCKIFKEFKESYHIEERKSVVYYWIQIARSRILTRDVLQAVWAGTDYQNTDRRWHVLYVLSIISYVCPDIAQLRYTTFKVQGVPRRGLLIIYFHLFLYRSLRNFIGPLMKATQNNILLKLKIVNYL